jgi:hypothetical protein
MVFSFSILPCISQNKTQFKYYVIDGVKTPQVKEIILGDTLSGQSIEFNVIDNNPFNHLDFPVDETDEYGNKIYTLTSKNVAQLIPDSSRGRFSEDRRTLSKSISIYGASSLSRVVTETPGYIIVYYNLAVYTKIDNGSTLQGVMGAITVLDSNGKSKFSDLQIDVGIGDAAVTSNGKWLSYSFGDMDEAGVLVPGGYRIIDIETGRIIFDKSHESLLGVTGAGNVTFVGYKLPEVDSTVFEVFFPQEMCLIKKKFSNFRMIDLIKITDEGFIIKKEDNQIVLETFEKQPNKETINR